MCVHLTFKHWLTGISQLFVHHIQLLQGESLYQFVSILLSPTIHPFFSRLSNHPPTLSFFLFLLISPLLAPFVCYLRCVLGAIICIQCLNPFFCLSCKHQSLDCRRLSVRSLSHCLCRLSSCTNCCLFFLPSLHSLPFKCCFATFPFRTNQCSSCVS